MKTFHASAMLAAVLAVTGTIAAASDAIPSSSDSFTMHGEVQGWTIYADTTTGSCLAEKTDAEGHAVQMGLTKDHQYGYIGVFTQAPTDIKSGQEIAIAVDGQVFVGESRGMTSKKLAGGYTGGYVTTNNPNFVNAIAEGRELVAFPEKTGAFAVNLAGTKAAIAELRTCNAGLAG